MDAQFLAGTQLLALAFFQNFGRFDSNLAWSGTLLLELIFYGFYVLERRDLRARNLIS